MKRKNGFILIVTVLLVTLGTTIMAAAAVKEGDSLQVAVDSAADGELILVEAGTHQISSLTISGKGITLRAVEGPDNTLLHFSGVGLVFTPHSGNQSTIEGFTLTDATQSAVKIDGASPKFKNCFFLDNMSYIYRGAACRVTNGSMQEISMATAKQTLSLWMIPSLAMNSAAMIYIMPPETGDVETIDDQVHAAAYSFEYDSVNRLQSATAVCDADPARAYSQAYTYDLAGNMTEKSGHGGFKVRNWQDP